MAIALSTSAFAQNAVLQNEYIKAGVNESTGTLGSGGNTSPGLLYDNTGSSTWNTAYDYLTPGSPYEGWAVRLDNTDGTLYKLYGNNNAGFQMDGNTTVSGAWVGTTSSSSAIWAGSTTEFDIKHTYSLPSAQKYLDITTRLDAKIVMPHLYFGRYIDPDAVAVSGYVDSSGVYHPGDSSATDNVRGYGVIPATNVVFSEATVSRYALGLYSAQVGNVNTSIQGWTSDPKNYYTGPGNYNVGNGDDTIGIGFYAANVAVGDILTWRYAYIFGPSAFSAANYAITGGAGGGTAGTSSFGTLVDVGSATDSASGGGTSTPTITSTSTATITVSDTTTINTSLPVITASLAHHEASEGNGKQTIARETTTNVTTPYTRSVVTLVRTTNTWSDSTTTTSDSATTTTNTLINDVQTSVANESFSGRIDQMNYLGNLNKQLDRGLNMDAFRTDGYRDEDRKITMYINGSGSKANINNGYSAKSQIYGLGVEKEINPNWRLGAQYNRANTTMDGTDSKTAQDKDHIGLFSVYTNENDVMFVNNLGYANNNIKGNRTIENVFNNSHSTKGDNVWLNNRVYAPETKGFRPYAGVTVGRSTTGGYTEAGDIQSARTVAKTTDNYTYGEAGVRYEKRIDDFRLAADVGRTTDSVTTGAVTVGYAPTKTGTIALTASTQQGNNINNNTLSLRGIIRF